MAAEIGNKWWMQRATHGRDLIFSSPEILWQACVEYFDATDKRKWVKQDWVGKDAIPVERKTDTPYTIGGLCLFLDIDRKTWALYRERNDFIPIVTRVEEIMYTQKYEGATTGAFNPNIIARDLGLADKKELEHKGEMRIEQTEFKITRRKK